MNWRLVCSRKIDQRIRELGLLHVTLRLTDTLPEDTLPNSVKRPMLGHFTEPISVKCPSIGHFIEWCSNRWGLSIPTQVYLYKTIIRPQLLYAEPIWAQRNYASLQVVQNRIIRSIMKHSMSPKKTAIEVLMGFPPIDSYCSSIEIKFLIKSVNKDDLVTATHVKTLTRPSSLSSLLLSKLRRFERTHMSHSYTRDSINAFIRDNWNRRWNSPYNDNFLRNFISNLPQETIHSPLLDGNPSIANMIIDLLIGSSRRLAENLWKLSRTPSPMCICGTSEQNSYHYFFYCPNYCNFRPFHLNSLDLFLSDDCAIIRYFISSTNII